MIPIILLASGNLGYQTITKLKNAKVSFLFTDKNSDTLISWANNNKIQYHIGNPRNLQNFELLNSYRSHWIVSVNYIFIIPKGMIEKVGNRALNIHGALLPKYRGRTPTTWAIINGEKKTGITVHLISEDVDAGDIVVQEEIPITDDDTGGTLLQKMGSCYPRIIDSVLLQIGAGELQTFKQDHSKMIYFPKRTPDDGEINWEWQKERIRNWVRAQTKPYPGAYTFYKRKKLKVWNCRFSETGYRHDMPNGLVIDSAGSRILVKTANGVIEITSYDCDLPIPVGCMLGSGEKSE